MLLLAGCGGPALPSGTAGGTERDEVERIYAHLTRVEARLRSREVVGLTGAQREARGDALDWLREYRQGRSYPHNHVRSFRTPVFVDPHGTPCAVGYLMLRSGEHAMVSDIVRESNLARVPELSGDPGLSRWLEEHGLSLEDAAAIQPAYGPPAPETHEGYQIATAGLGFASTLVAAHNALTKDQPRDGTPWGGLLGMGLGMAHAGLAMSAFTAEPNRPGWAVAVNTFGAFASTMVSLRKLRGQASVPEDASEGAPVVQPLISAGRGGVTLGLSVSH
jgi:hypothetical protein